MAASYRQVYWKTSCAQFSQALRFPTSRPILQYVIIYIFTTSATLFGADCWGPLSSAHGRTILNKAIPIYSPPCTYSAYLGCVYYILLWLMLATTPSAHIYIYNVSVIKHVYNCIRAFIAHFPGPYTLFRFADSINNIVFSFGQPKDRWKIFGYFQTRLDQISGTWFFRFSTRPICNYIFIKLIKIPTSWTIQSPCWIFHEAERIKLFWSRARDSALLEWSPLEWEWGKSKNRKNGSSCIS